MAKKPQHTSVNQTAIGNDNIQVVGNNNVITRISNFFAGDTEQQRALRNRRAMLELVKNTWIKGVLEKSLYNEVLIELGMEERPGAVDHPWDMQVQMPNQINRTLPTGTSIMDVFDGMNGAMLILGEPGSGKTTMLLELARDCIDHAMQDDNEPIPVIFNLSSWSDPQQKIDDWLTKELNTKYNVPKKTAQNWIENDDLQLLLDGLDEVKLENRETCVKAINDFRQRHGLVTPIAVCSRVADYETLTTQLTLQGALLLQPLTNEQIETYFEQVGSQLEGIYEVLKNDETLQELVKQPLMLSIMILAYQGKSVNIYEKENLDPIGARRKHLFDTYIQQMFERVSRTKNELFSLEQTKYCLGWLAYNIKGQARTFFQVEKIQPAWLRTSTEVRHYGIVSRVVSGLILGVMLAVFVGQINWLLDGVVIGTLYGLIAGLSFHNAAFRSVKTNYVLKRDAVIIVLTGLLGGLYSAASYLFRRYPFGIHPGIDQVLLNGIVDGVFYGIIGGIFYKVVNGKRSAEDDIETVEVLQWSWKSFWQGIVSGIGVGIVIGGIFGVVLGVIFLLYGKFINLQYEYGFVDGLKTGSRLGLFIGPSIGVGVRLRRSLISQEVAKTTYPNQGIWLSMKNGLLIGSTIAILNIFIFGLYAGINNLILQSSRSFIPSFSSETVLLWGISSGIILFLFFGGYTVIQHAILRFELWREGVIPLNYITFLDYCTERIFLRRVGGGYIFVHRLLMEHFADMYPVSEK
jgi:eukaryotic-like serine/threonine-protein kinase